MKLCVGATAPGDLLRYQSSVRRALGIDHAIHVTRMQPKRADEILDGGSLYWIIQGSFALRQRVIGLRSVTVEDGTRKCEIALDPDHIAVAPIPRRPFQGWRYLTDEDAPRDGGGSGEDGHALTRALSELGLL